MKIIKAYIPEKVKLYIENKLSKEIEYFEKKYTFKINLLANTKLVIPEYKIELLNKSKKVINTIENIDKINELKENPKSNKKPYNPQNESKINLKKLKKTKTI